MAKKQTYSEQIQSPKWQKKRLEILNLRGFKCEECGNEEQQLHVHHRAYIKNRKAWEYDNDIYQVLCSNCHEKVHQKKVVEVRENIPDIYRQILKLIDDWQSIDPDIANNLKFILQDLLPEDGDNTTFIFGDISTICQSDYFSRFVSCIHDYSARIAFELGTDMRLCAIERELKINN